MQAPVRPNRPRASGGRTLILLGVLLALAAGAIVIFVVSQYGGSPLASTEMVVVANQDLPAGAVLSTTKSGVDATTHITYIPISAAFVTKSVNADFAPKDAYPFKSQSDLTALLNNEVVASNFYAGEILRTNDPRLMAAGSGAPGSLTTLNPGKMSNGQVLAQISLSSKPAVVPGDYVNVLATYCNIPNKSNKCETQTTLKNVYVYAVSGNTVFVVLSNQDAVNTLYLTTTASNYELVIRKPGDTTVPTTTPADNGTISQAFNY
jgi:Flp pilus assembly protein CpaB